SFGFSCSQCTISDPSDGDPEVTAFGTSTLVFANSIVAGDCSVEAGSAIDSLGGNVESPGSSCSFDQATDLPGQTSVQLGLGPLADNGGQMRTHLPAADSVAIGNAVDALCTPLGDDQ